ncbi:MAG: hypothetical protein HUJ57_07260 [Erysipelotrichaceae bacterium]|nr:hypothetical protein [Erysipelotrichaceae bacterium]
MNIEALALEYRDLAPEEEEDLEVDHYLCDRINEILACRSHDQLIGLMSDEDYY